MTKRALGIIIAGSGAVILLNGTIFATEIKIVSPSLYAASDAPDAITNGADNIRGQQVFSAADFAALPPGQNLLSSIGIRVDSSLSLPRTTSYSSFLIRFSTTSKSSPNLSFNFAENIGLDETIVYQGPLTISTSPTNSGIPGGSAQFDFYNIDLQTPFSYDPAKGNLLFDFEFYRQGPDPGFDFLLSASPASQMVTNFAGNSIAGFNWGGVVVDFTFVPEPSTLFVCCIGMLRWAACDNRRRSDPR
jgi:hypothetical protein